MNFSNNLKKLRKEKGLSQEELAEKLNVSRQSVSKWESGATYPEMDKVLLICKLFNCNINEIMHEDVSEISSARESKNIFNKYIEDFFAYLTKSVDMFISFDFGGKIKCLFEEVITGFVIYIIFAVIKLAVGGIFSNVFDFLPAKIFSLTGNIISIIYMVLALILGIIIFLHTFKIRYLDYYDDTIKKNDEEDNTKNKEVDTKTTNERVNNQKIIIRDPDHSESKFISGLFKVFIWCVKIIFVTFAIWFVFSFIFFVISLVIELTFIKTGLTFLGIFIGTLACLAINYVILELSYDFLFNKKVHAKRLGLTALAGLIGIGVGIGLFIIDLPNYKIDNDRDSFVETKEVYNMNDKFCVHSYDKVNYVESDINNVEVSINHSKYVNVNVNNTDSVGNGCIYVYSEFNEKLTKEFYKYEKEGLYEKKVIVPKDIEITIKANKENLETIKSNSKNYTLEGQA